VQPAAPVSGDDLKRAERFTREPLVLDGEDAAVALAEGTARRAALDAALAELDSGSAEPSVEWRRDYSLILGLERLLSEEEPHLADGTTLSAHQVDALSGTLIALTSEVQAARNGSSRNGSGPVEELPSAEVEIEGDEEVDEEPLDWDAAEEAEEEAAAEAAVEDPGAPRRFWFEHATGAGKTVAALGFV
jgi:ribonuclease E